MLHIVDISAPYSKVTSNDFNFQNYYSIIFNLTLTILLKKPQDVVLELMYPE